MFRAAPNAFDEAVVKATDENLTSENWELILNVCDRVEAAPDGSGAKDAVAALIKRLAHRNANVQLYALELANALSQNCGPAMHRELASRSFTEALTRLAGERTTHREVKARILERMAEWTEMFSKDRDLGIMEQAYMKLKSQNPNLDPPSKPQKAQITDADRRREEEELQMALALSIKDKGPETGAAPQQQQQAESSSQAAQQPQEQPHAAVPSGTTAATVSRVRALYDFQPSEPGELAFRKGDVIAVLESVYKDWWKGSLRGQTGIFPLNYVEKLQDPTRAELEREAQMEAEVFAEIRNVEKLLALLSTSSRASEGDVRDNEEITKLYHSTLAIRPKLIELIGKYSQKKDDFTQLNEKFIKARRDYETLLEASMSQPPQPTYGRQSFSYAAPHQTGYGRPVSTYPPPGPPHGHVQVPHDAGPQRYFSPGPQGQPEPQASYQPPQSDSTQYYTAPPSQSARDHAATPSDPYGASQAGHAAAGRPPFPPAGTHPSAPYGHAPHASSTAGLPQELASNPYDSPVDGRPGTFAPPGQSQAQDPYAAGYDPYAQQQQAQQQQQQQPPPQQPQQQQPSAPSQYGYAPPDRPAPGAPPSQSPAHHQPQQPQPQQAPYDPQSSAHDDPYGAPQQSSYPQPSHDPQSQPQQPPQHAYPPPTASAPPPDSPVAPSGPYPAVGGRPAAGSTAGSTVGGYQPYRPQQASPGPGGLVGGGGGGSGDAEGFYR